MMRIRHLLKDKNFSLLWFSQIVSNFGDRLNQMALIGLVYARTPGSTTELAKLLSFTILPVFLLGPIAGICVDRWNRKYTMVTCDLIRGISVLFIPFVIFYSKNMVPIYILVFIIFSATRFFLPAKLSIIPDIVDKDKLLLANSLTSTTRMIAAIVGFGFGGIIVARLGAEGGFYVDAATYFISGLMLVFVVLRFKKKADAPAQNGKLKSLVKKAIIEDIKEGWAYFKGHRDIRMVANTMLLIMSGVGSIYIIIIVFVQESLGSSTEHLGLLAMFLGAGLFIGSLVYGRFGTKLCKKDVINSSLCVTGLAIVIFSIGLKIYPSFLVAVFLSTLLGISASPIIVSSSTLLHEVMVEEMRGRVFTLLDIVMHIGFLFSMLITSLVAERIEKGTVLIVVGAVFSVIGVVKLIREIKQKKEESFG
ncbi:MFS transporter [Candidatus Omnitrophota bacterium]